MERRVLLVDDETVMLKLLEIILQSDGYTVTSAASGEEAVDYLSKNSFDLLITDLELGKLCGYDVIVAAKRENPAITAIMISGCYGTKYQTTAYGIGADDFLAKPFSTTDLLGCVHRHMGVMSSTTKMMVSA